MHIGHVRVVSQAGCKVPVSAIYQWRTDRIPCYSPFVVSILPSSIPRVFVLLLLPRLSGQPVRTIAVCSEVALPGGRRRGAGGGSLEVSLTILRNFVDSLARVDHVRPVLRSHGSGREGENGFSRGSEGSEGGKRERTREASRTRLRRSHGLASAKGSFTTVSQDMHTWRTRGLETWPLPRVPKHPLPVKDPCASIPPATA